MIYSKKENYLVKEYEYLKLSKRTIVHQKHMRKQWEFLKVITNAIDGKWYTVIHFFNSPLIA